MPGPLRGGGLASGAAVAPAADEDEVLPDASVERGASAEARVAEPESSAAAAAAWDPLEDAGAEEELDAALVRPAKRRRGESAKSGLKRKREPETCGPASGGAGPAVEALPAPPQSDPAAQWRVFTPAVVDPAKCMARTWGGGNGGQCRTRAPHGSQYCKTHAAMHEAFSRDGSGGWHGAVDGPIPARKLAEFQRARSRAAT